MTTTAATTERARTIAGVGSTATSGGSTGAAASAPASASGFASSAAAAASAAAATLPKQPFAFDTTTLGYSIAGMMARCTGAVLTSPLDTLKTRLQFEQRAKGVRQELNSFGAPATAAPATATATTASPATATAANTTATATASSSSASSARRSLPTLLHAAKTIYRQEGLGAFYKGLPIRLVYIGPAAAVSFVFYEQFRYLYRLPDHSSSNKFLWFVPLALGGVARVAGTALRTPFDVLRQRMQIQGGLSAYRRSAALPSTGDLPRGVYSGNVDAVQKVFRTEGVKAFWAGFGATILRDVPFAAVYFLSYETMKDAQTKVIEWNRRRRGLPPSTTPPSDRKLKGRNYLVAGAGAAACAVSVTMPMDVVKTRLQTQGALEGQRYKGVFHCFQTIVKEDGVRGLWRGYSARLLYLCPSAAITFACYEFYKGVIHRVLVPLPDSKSPPPAHA